MINRISNQASKHSFIPKFSDPDILRYVLNSDFWKLLFLRDKKAVWIFFSALLVLKMELFVSPLKMVLRYNHGKRTTGIFIIVMTALTIMGFNTRYLVGYFSTFIPFIVPVLPFLMSGEQLIDAVFVSIHSQNLLVFLGIYLVLSLVQLVVIYKAFGSTNTFPNKRGTSILFTLIFKHLGVSENAVQRFIEPIFVGSIGYVLIVMKVDFTFGLFLIIAAILLFAQEIYDAIRLFAISR